MARPTVFHIVAADDWDTALISGTYAPDSLVGEGFIHLSYRDQVTGVANRFYRDLDGLVVVELDPDLLEGDIVDEDLHGEGQLFPHSYGPVTTRAAVAVHPLPRTDDGSYAFS